ncbi:hypothetical protein L1049_019610 [Liquidambar formosana]|uniref:XPG-I domain-containing protein n=1 Tax=Liquidambar formosana TaxID=63359 RepID=A0AAP0SBZ1_LIQFO
MCTIKLRIIMCEFKLFYLIVLGLSDLISTRGSSWAAPQRYYCCCCYFLYQDGCFTSDSDIFLFGGRTVYREICLGEGGYVICYKMADIERILGFGRNSLITLALLLGSDYSQGVHKLGSSACQIVKSVGDVVLKRIASEGLSFAKKSKGSRKQGQVHKCNYKENCSDHELNTNIWVLALYPFQRSKLQQICTQFFEWPPEKTDEYILPKIAERDLRRFANLRSTSPDLELQFPLREKFRGENALRFPGKSWTGLK